MANEVKGLKELAGKLSKLETSLAVKSLRSAIFKATTPVVRQMKSRIPVGTEAHRTYKKRLVAPSFAQRSIKRLTGKRYLSQGKLSIAIGVRAEAYYAIRFYDQGPYTLHNHAAQTVNEQKGKGPCREPEKKDIYQALYVAENALV